MSPGARAKAFMALAGAAIGALNALVFLGFEWVVKHGTDYIWNDVFGTDSARWRVVPLAIGLSVAFSVVLRTARQERVIAPHTELLGEGEEVGPASVADVALILVVGAAGLLAGASLGPEATLAAASVAMGAWVVGSAGAPSARKLLALSSVGALLVAFFGSIAPVAIPLLMLLKQERKLVIGHALPPILAALASYGTLLVVHGHKTGFGTIPAPEDFDASDFATAVVLGAFGVLVARLLHRFIERLGDVTKRIDTSLPWWAAAALFGAVLGGLYWAGGESVQFSGSEGVGILLREHADAGVLTFIGLALVKLLATSWSLTAGYRGGLIFPSVYTGLAVSLLVGSIASGLAGPGATIGMIGGLFAILTSPVLGAVMLIALLPPDLLPIALAGAAGAIAGDKAIPWMRLRPGSGSRTDSAG